MRAARVFVAIVWLVAVSASGQVGAPTAAEDDPLELARAVDRAGDRALLAVLEREPTLAAVRGSGSLDAPELALPALARIAAGRDPELAPSAAAAMLAIAQRIDPVALESREADLDALRSVRASLRALAADDTARDDLRAAATLVEAALGANGVADP